MGIGYFLSLASLLAMTGVACEGATVSSPAGPPASDAGADANKAPPKNDAAPRPEASIDPDSSIARNCQGLDCAPCPGTQQAPAGTCVNGLLVCNNCLGMAEAGAVEASAVADAGTVTVHKTSHDCAPGCGAADYCAYPYPGGFCPLQGDSGVCPPGCPGCPPLPPPACTVLPTACNGVASCQCLLTECTGFGGECYIDADGDFVLGCMGG